MALISSCINQQDTINSTFIKKGLMSCMKDLFNTSLHDVQINKNNKTKCAFSSSPAIENKKYNYREALSFQIEDPFAHRFKQTHSKNPRVKMTRRRS
jgi:hypothetical protein